MSDRGDARAVAGPFDPGLQLERTSLSWRRTALSLAAGSLIALRLLPLWLGEMLWVVPGMVGLVAAAALWGVSRRRHHAFMAQVEQRRTPRVAGAGVLLALTAWASAVGMLALVAVLLAAR
ncbi:DUF202 domain-containing protein [Microbacterium sp. USHLN186]|uniref:DUF202 domain-containing protein n=1 Tax=Microbacterium sp. USHLN186 TaxID=3081286 RepID=UPI0030166CD4